MTQRDDWFDEVGRADKQACEGDCSRLAFTHGIETEYFMVDRGGEKLSHADFGDTYNSLISLNLIKELEDDIPKFYGTKVSSVKMGRSKSSTFDALILDYLVRDRYIKTELVSVDRNVAEWPLLELATPPCESLYELAWWSTALYKLVNLRLEKLGNHFHIIPFGVHPLERIENITQGESFPTCGEHHHIMVVENSNMSQDDRARFTNFYHLVRFFTAYLILLSACSPFASGRIWGRYVPEDTELPFPRCLRSVRVIYNKKHLCNFQEGEYMPYLNEGWLNMRYFLREFQGQSNSFRSDTHFLDVDPYSSKNHTTEIRFFDSQPSVARRVGLAALLQMLALKAGKLADRDEDNIARVLSESNTNLHALKKMACEGGNWFRPSMDPIFGGISETVKLKNTRIQKNVMSDLVLEMLYLLRNEISESKLVYSHFLEPIRQSIYGMEGDGISPALYWLFKYIELGRDMDLVIKSIITSADKASRIWYDPLVNEPIMLSDVLDVRRRR
jgi:gamma-glutamyl:cysteine ligase YbdK (ATP-grasp superfamily)